MLSVAAVDAFVPSVVTVLPFSSVTICSCDEAETYSPSGFLLFAEQPAMQAAIDTARAKDIIAVVE